MTTQSLGEIMQELMRELQASREEIAALRQEVAELRGAPAHAAPAPAYEVKAAYTYQEAADIWGVSYRTVQGYVASRRVLTIDCGGPRIPHAELERVLKRGVPRAGAAPGEKGRRAGLRVGTRGR